MRDLLAEGGRVQTAMMDALWGLGRNSPSMPTWNIRWLFERTNGGCPWPLPNVWLGTSIESDEYAWRADDLRKTPAAVRFLSLEPLLGPLPRLDLGGFDRVITGGESGPGARPMDPHWARTIRNQCRAKGVAFLHKQTVNGQQQASTVPGFCTAQGFTAQQRRTLRTDSCSTKSCSVGKKAAGRELDGHTWDEFAMPFERRDSA
jgi:protein gp37